MELELISSPKAFPTLEKLQKHLNNMNNETSFAIKKLTWKWVINELLPKHKERIETKPLPKDKCKNGLYRQG